MLYQTLLFYIILVWIKLQASLCQGKKQNYFHTRISILINSVIQFIDDENPSKRLRLIYEASLVYFATTKFFLMEIVNAGTQKNNGH